MRYSKLCKAAASSLLESVIAMTLIAICIAAGMVTFGTVLQTDHNIAFYQAQQKVKELVYQTKQEQLFENEDYDFKTYQIQKRVEPSETKWSYQLDFIVTVNNTKKKYTYIVSP